MVPSEQNIRCPESFDRSKIHPVQCEVLLDWHSKAGPYKLWMYKLAASLFIIRVQISVTK